MYENIEIPVYDNYLDKKYLYLNIPGIYGIFNTKSAKTYIGKAKNVFSRLENHLNGFKKGKAINNHFTNALHKYGIKSFKFIFMVEYKVNDKFSKLENDILLTSLEKTYIKAYHTLDRKTGYNKRLSNMKTEVNYSIDDSTRVRMSNSHKGKPSGSKDKKWSDQQKQNLRILRKGENNSRYTHLDEVALVKEYETIKNIKELAKKHLCSTKTIERRLRKNNIDLPLKKRMKIKIRDEKIKEFYNQDYSNEEIAIKLNVTPKVIYDRKRKMNLKLIKSFLGLIIK
uniref:Putative endonuclease n=2 Tax=viral metagenome TaxID=1070528 RepID=A0A6M3M7F7_9ZZZZ